MLRFLPIRSPTIPPATHTNCFILGNKHLTIVDPGTADSAELERLSAYVEDLCKRSEASVRSLFVTHHHKDHTSGVPFLAERFRDTLQSIRAHKETLRKSADLFADVQSLCVSVGDGDTVPAADSAPDADPSNDWRVIETPGHAPGHLCLHCPATGRVLAGDMCASVGSIVLIPPDGDLALYLASLQKLVDLNPSILIPAHGPPLVDSSHPSVEVAAFQCCGFDTQHPGGVDNPNARALRTSTSDTAPGVVGGSLPAPFASTPDALRAVMLKPPSQHLREYAAHRDARTQSILAALRVFTTSACEAESEGVSSVDTAACAVRDSCTAPLPTPSVTLPEGIIKAARAAAIASSKATGARDITANVYGSVPATLPASGGEGGGTPTASHPPPACGDLVEAVYGDTIPPAVKPLAAAQVLCHLMFLEGQGVVRCISKGIKSVDTQWVATG